jgi:aminoglycoside phosphotransferase (APT) family kinase protein
MPDVTGVRVGPVPVPIPQLLAEPITSTRWSGILISRVPGGPYAGGVLSSTQQAGYSNLLTALSALDPIAFVDLSPPRTWCGGAAWPELVSSDLTPLLPITARRSAAIRVSELIQAESIAQTSVCHGDFGPHNITWDGDRAIGLFDLDHACIGDPAIDIAPLIGFHGAAAVAGLAAPALFRRAMLHRATLSLQVAAAAHLNGSIALRDRALRSFASRDQQGTLFDPNGLDPRDLPDQD